MTPDKYQQAFIDFVCKPGPSVIADAKAGSGKSSTVEATLSALSGRKSTTVLAFNKSIATAMQERIERAGVPKARASTFNSIGHGALARELKNLKLERWKSGLIMKDLGIYFKERFDMQTVERLVGIAKANNLEPGQVPWSELATHMGFAIPAEMEQAILTAADRVFTMTIPWALERGIIDFDDQLYLPIQLKLPFYRVDYLFVDESQDVSPVQIEMIARAVNERVVCVGDVRQAIYGFRGADSTAMSNLQTRFKAEALPLNICYRCDKAIIERVQRLVPEIEARPNAGPGLVRSARDVELRDFGSEDMILCRTNAPLFQLASIMIHARYPFQIKGEGVSEVLGSYYIKIFQHSGWRLGSNPDIDEFWSGAREWFEMEINRYEKRGAFGMCDTLEDYRAILGALCSIPGLESFNDMLAALEKVLAGRTGVTLSSVHRAKGLEARRVWIYRPDLMPSSKAKTDWAKEQERNLIYVAETRAMEELVLLHSVAGEPEEEEA